jgi:hypothetical protein
MRPSVITAVLLGVGLVGVGVYALGQRDRVKELTSSTDAFRATFDDLATCNATLGELRAKLGGCEAAFSKATDEIANPSGNWWCYMGRECFRSADECTQAGREPDRKTECAASQLAWCGGKDGHACFLRPADCHALEDSGGRSCVLIR